MEIELDSIRVVHGERTVLEKVSFSFPPQKTTVILGPAGSGKSVLLKVAGGILDPDSGSVVADGRRLSSLSERQNREFRRRTGFVFQDAALWSNSTLLQNISLPLRVHFPAMSEEDAARRVDSLVSRIGFEEDLRVRPADTSPGGRKIVSFARAVIGDPETLFMDEPLAEIHHQVAERMLDVIRDLKRRRRTIIMVTHDPVLTSQVADWLLVLQNGRILEGGTTAKVASSTNPQVIATLTRVLSQASTFDGSILDLLDQDTGP